MIIKLKLYSGLNSLNQVGRSIKKTFEPLGMYLLPSNILRFKNLYSRLYRMSAAASLMPSNTSSQATVL